MYKPNHTQQATTQSEIDLMIRYPFITLISMGEANQPFISHIPVHAEIKNYEVLWVEGHLSIRNPHVQHLKKNPQARIIFQGPHCYISPKWYKSGRDVPTWNYAVVHVTGLVEFDSSFEGICSNLKNLTNNFETGPDKWIFELPSDLQKPEDLTSAIISFKLKPEKIESKFKLNLNRPEVDIISVIEQLEQKKSDQELQIAMLMKKIRK